MSLAVYFAQLIKLLLRIKKRETNEKRANRLRKHGNEATTLKHMNLKHGGLGRLLRSKTNEIMKKVSSIVKSFFVFCGPIQSVKYKQPSSSTNSTLVIVLYVCVGW